MTHSAKEPATPEQIALVQKLFLTHSDAIKGFLLALVPVRDQVEDLLHATFLTVVDKAADFEKGSNFVAWSRAIARFETLRTRRIDANSPIIFSSELVDKLASEAPDFDLGEERLSVLAECYETLSPQQRDALDMQYRQALKPAQVAERLDMAPATVYVLLSRARTLLKKCIERKLRVMEGR